MAAATAMTRRASGMLDRWWRWGAAAGILFVVLFIVGLIVQGSTPSVDDPVTKVKDYFLDHRDRWLVGDYLIGLAFLLFFLPFLSCLRGLLARAEGDEAVWSRVVFAAGIAFLVVGAATSLAQGALAYGAVAHAGDDVIQTLTDIDYYGFTTISLAAGVLVLAASIVILRTGILWAWLGGLGLLEAVIAVIAPLAVLSRDPDSALGILGFIAFIGFGVWIILVAVGMWMTKALPDRAAADR